MRKQKLDTKRALTWRVVFTLVLLATVFYVLAQNLNVALSSLRAARDARPGWFLLAVFGMISTFCIAAAIYNTLALHKLRYRQTLLVSLGASFANRLLPAGLGGLGLNGVYLYRRKHTPAEATIVVSVNNLLGIAAHVLILVVVLLVEPSVVFSLPSRHLHIPGSLVVIAILLLGLTLCIPWIQNKLVRLVRNLTISVRKLTVTSLLRALALSGLLTATYTFILYGAVRSISGDLGLLQVFIVFSIGTLTGTATPTPGGLVGAEAGLFAGFVVYGMADSRAGTVVLLFRLVTYWLPLIPGAVALVVSRNKDLL